MKAQVPADWKAELNPEFQKDYFKQLSQFVDSAYADGICYPPAYKLFAAFRRCPIEKVRVVVLGQDPYHGPRMANGLSFSVAEGVSIPSSLRNIFKEIKADLGLPNPTSGNLERWADQGVLLLNAILTVRAEEAASHRKKGWETFTDAVIERINNKHEGVVFLLWGAYAQKKGSAIDRKRHLVLESPHPSGLSAHRGFFGNKHFSQTNAYLESRGQTPIDWS